MVVWPLSFCLLIGYPQHFKNCSQRAQYASGNAVFAAYGRGLQVVIKGRTPRSDHRPSRALVKRGQNNLPKIYLAQGRHGKDDVYASELGDGSGLARLKWIIGTCLAGSVGIAAIGFAIYASMDVQDDVSIITTMREAGKSALEPIKLSMQKASSLRSATHKTDRLQVSADGLSTRHIIHDSVREKRAGREFIKIKPYVRIVARLATAQPDRLDVIPVFNPLKLYADMSPINLARTGTTSNATSRKLAFKVVELVGGLLPDEDNQMLDDREAADLTTAALEGVAAPDEALRPGIASPDDDADNGLNSGTEASLELSAATTLLPPRTTVLEKNVYAQDNDATLDDRETQVIKVKRGDNLMRLIKRVGAENWQAVAIVEAASNIFPAKALSVGQLVHFELVRSLTDGNRKDPVRVSIFDGGQRHRVTVVRNSAGDYVGSKRPVGPNINFSLNGTPQQQRASLYAGLYSSALLQKLPPALINRILRLHAYDTDFKKRVAPGDGFELFFDVKEGAAGTEDALGELLYTSISAAGETREFFRFRTPDGVVDFYDKNGDNVRKFLMRKPVKGGGVRYTSGFGYRFHPVLKKRKMHTGIDYAARRGTPVLAAGNGVIEAAGRKGGYGNYVRIRHANGYKTAYAHLRKFGKGVRKGVRVKQGQVIAYVGNTGRSTGTHLHYEVLVNNRHVNPMKIQVPRGRQLRGKLLREFRKEQRRVAKLKNRAPVTTRVAQAGGHANAGPNSR